MVFSRSGDPRGICYYLSAYLINRNLGSFAAAVYMSLLYFYIQPLIGTAYTEPLGLAFGCLGFVLLWTAAKKQNVLDLILGLIIFTVALSVRAGAFFILPALILWSGLGIPRRKTIFSEICRNSRSRFTHNICSDQYCL